MDSLTQRLRMTTASDAANMPTTVRDDCHAAADRLAEAMKALEMFPELFLSFVGPVNDEWFNRFADAVKNARRVREGGKVE